MKEFDLFEVLEPADFDSINTIRIKTKRKPSKSVKKRIRQIPKQNRHFILKRKPVLIAAVCAAILIVLSLAACTNESFRNWFMSFFDITPQITKENVIETEDGRYNYNVYDGFIVTNPNTQNTKVFEYEDGHFTQKKMQHCSGSFQGYHFSFDYFINDRAMAVSNIESDLEGFRVDYLPGSTTKAIASISQEIGEADKFHDIWLVDLITGKIEPLIDRSTADWFEQAEIPEEYLGEFTSRRYAIDAEPSKDGRFILFESNRECYPVLNNSGKMGSSHAYIHDRKTDAEWKIDSDMVPWGGNKYWINDRMILFNAEGPSMQIYDAIERKIIKEFTIYTEIFWTNNTVYSILDTGDTYIFTDRLTEEQFQIEKSTWESLQASGSDGNCYYTNVFDDGCSLYDLNAHTRIDFPYGYLDADNFSVFFMNDNTMLFCANKEGEDQPRFYIANMTDTTYQYTEAKIF